MRTISHREMRNDSGRVLASVEAGESYTVTSNGRPVARLVPVAGGMPIPAARRPASVRGGFAGLTRQTVDGTVADHLADLRADR